MSYLSIPFRKTTARRASDFFRRPIVYESGFQIAAAIAALAASIRYFPDGDHVRIEPTMKSWIVFIALSLSFLTAVGFTVCKGMSQRDEYFGPDNCWKMSNEACLFFTIDRLAEVSGSTWENAGLCACIYKPIEGTDPVLLEQVTDYVGYEYENRSESDSVGQRIRCGEGVVGQAFRARVVAKAIKPDGVLPRDWNQSLGKEWEMPESVRKRVNLEANAFLAFPVPNSDDLLMPSAVLYFEAHSRDLFHRPGIEAALVTSVQSLAAVISKYDR